MRDKLNLLVQKIETLSLRERILVLIAILIALHQIWDSTIWRPLVQQDESLSAQEAAANDALLQTQVELKIITAKANRDPDKETRIEIKNLQSQLAVLKQEIDKTSQSLVSPADMAQLLESLLTSEKGLRLIKLQTGDSEPLITEEQQERHSTNYQIYRHAFTIEFAGGYMATLRYIEALEELPWRFFWDGIDYTVDDYPNSIVRLKLYTLSLSEGWIGV